MKKPTFNHSIALAMALAASVGAAPVFAQDSGGRDNRGISERGNSGGSGRGDRAVTIQPYIEVSQTVTAELEPGDEVVTHTRLAAGIDASVTGRNNGGSVSLRYEKSFGYGDNAIDNSTISGVARGYASIVPRALTVEAGAMASQTRIDESGAAIPNPLNGGGSKSQIYSAYAGPSLNTRAGAVDVNANYRIGYTRIDLPDVVTPPVGTDTGGGVADVFDDSVSQNAAVRLGTRPGDVLPVGVGVGAQWSQEDVSNLDQRVRDFNVRGDVQVPLSRDLSLVAGVGYEDVQVSSRDALRDDAGNPVIGSDGRFQTDKSQDRQIAYEVSGLIWDVGVVWRPSTRTAFEAHVGRRYDSMSYTGSLSYAPNRNSSLNVSVYDTVSGFGNRLNTALANLPTEFTAARNSLSGDLSGCVTGSEGGGCVNGALGSVRSSIFRSRGINASYSTRLGRLSTGVAVGYDRRNFLAAPGTVLSVANGVTDESYYARVFLSGNLDQRSSFSTNAYLNYFDSGFSLAGDSMGYGASAAYSRNLTSRLSARAAIAIDSIETDVSDADFTAASALFGLRLGF